MHRQNTWGGRCLGLLGSDGNKVLQCFIGYNFANAGGREEKRRTWYSGTVLTNRAGLHRPGFIKNFTKAVNIKDCWVYWDGEPLMLVNILNQSGATDVRKFTYRNKFTLRQQTVAILSGTMARNEWSFFSMMVPYHVDAKWKL